MERAMANLVSDLQKEGIFVSQISQTHDMIELEISEKDIDRTK